VPLAALCGVALLGTVIAAVHHAEVIAHRVGEPLGTPVLALAVTVIEASLILPRSRAAPTWQRFRATRSTRRR
jgi:Ca2+/H+ antiporter